MENEKNYFNLEQVAEVCGQSVEAIKTVIFEGNCLSPSYHIKSPVRSALYIELQTQADKEKGEYGKTFRFLSGLQYIRMIPKRIKQPLSPYVSTMRKARFFDSINTERRQQQSPFNARFTGIVDIYTCSRHSGKFDGKTELHPNYGRKPPGIDGFLERPRVYHRTQSGLLILLGLLESCELSEDKLIVHRDQLKQFIRNDHEAMQRYEQLSGTGVNAAMPEYLPPYLDETNNNYAPELAALVKVWLELYEGGKYKKHLCPTANIAPLLIEKGLTKTAAKTVARVAIPLKDKNGRPKSEK